MITKEQITAALKKLGSVSPGELADHLEVDRAALGYHLKKLLDSGEVQAAGNSTARRVALPDQTIDTTPGAPPSSSNTRPAKKKKSKARAAKRSKKASSPRAPKTPAAAPPAAARDFLTAITADSRLVIVNGAQAPLIFSEKESEQIAELCLAHFED